MLPEGWIRCAVGEMGTVHAGRQRNPNFVDGDLRPYLRVANVFDGRIDLTDVHSMPFTAEEFERYKLVPGDILLNEGQSAELVGRPAMYTGPSSTYCFQNTLVRFTASERVLPSFALLKFQQCLYDGTFQGIAKKTTSIAHLGVSRFSALELDWPTIAEQNQIVQKTEIWDKAIENAEKLLIHSRKQKLFLMGALLSGKWSRGKCIDVFNRRHASELFQPISMRRNDGLELLSVTQEFGVIPRNSLDRKVVMPEGSMSAYKLVERGDFIISLRSFEGGLEYSRYRGLVSPAYTVIRAKQPICDDFYRHYFKSQDFIGRLAIAVIGIRDGKQINYDDFAFLKLPYPTLEEQNAIAAVLNDAESEISQLRTQVEALRSEKRALMTALLTGRRRVRSPRVQISVSESI